MLQIILIIVSFFQESAEIDDDNSHTLTSNVQSISSFDDIQQLINTSNSIPLTIFLNFLLTDANSDPSHLVICFCFLKSIEFYLIHLAILYIH
jgi:hypothetical protein